MSPPAQKTQLSFLLNADDLPLPLPTTTKRRRIRKPRARKYVCPHCQFGFYTNSDRHKHVTSVHLQLRPFGCTLCCKRFGEKSNATKHFKSVHERLRTAKCDRCDAVFAFRDGLARHIRLVHEGVRKFQCSVPGCKSIAFKQSAHLKKHMQSVHKIELSSPRSPTLNNFRQIVDVHDGNDEGSGLKV